MASVIEEVSRKDKEDKNIALNQEDIQESAAKHKASFMEEFEKGISIEESRKKVYAKIDSLWSK